MLHWLEFLRKQPLARSSLWLEELDAESVFDQPNVEVASCCNHIVVEVVVTRVQRARVCAWLHQAESPETSRLLVQEVAEVFAGSDWKLIFRDVLRPEPLGCESFNVPCLSGMVVHAGVKVVKSDFNFALHGAADFFCYAFDPLADSLSSRLIVASDSSFHHSFIWEDIEDGASIELAYSECNVLLTVNITRLDRVKSLVDRVCRRDAICKLVWCRTMATASDDTNLDYSDCSKEAADTDTDVTFVEVGNVVEAVYLINTLHAAFSNHRQSSTW